MDMGPRGGKRDGAGRKPAIKGKPINKRLMIMLREADMLALDLAAKMEDKTPSQLARDLIVDNLPETF